MHKDIVEHVARDRGYNEGYKAGKKRAWDLMGELAEYYKEQLNPNPLAPPHQCDLEHGRWQAALYAQMVIKQDGLS